MHNTYTHQLKFGLFLNVEFGLGKRKRQDHLDNVRCSGGCDWWSSRRRGGECRGGGWGRTCNCVFCRMGNSTLCYPLSLSLSLSLLFFLSFFVSLCLCVGVCVCFVFVYLPEVTWGAGVVVIVADVVSSVIIFADVVLSVMSSSEATDDDIEAINNTPSKPAHHLHSHNGSEELVWKEDKKATNAWSFSGSTSLSWNISAVCAVLVPCFLLCVPVVNVPSPGPRQKFKFPKKKNWSSPKKNSKSLPHSMWLPLEGTRTPIRWNHLAPDLARARTSRFHCQSHDSQWYLSLDGPKKLLDRQCVSLPPWKVKKLAELIRSEKS